jgi:phosphatidylserine decarboxylase
MPTADENNAWTFYHRYHEAIEAEPIYGEKWLRWAYERPLGRATTWAVAKRAWFSHFYGWLMSRPRSAAKIAPFVEEYGLDAADFAEPLTAYGSFNEFFYRRLKPQARPIAADPAAAVFPADGRHLLLPTLGEGTRVWAKGESFDLAEILDSAALAEGFAGGAAVVSRLCPLDYHRFHFPVAGEAGPSRLVQGPLFSVHPIAVARSTRYLTANKRSICLVETEPFGRVAVIEIGATNVGSIHQTYAPGAVAKGAEKGYFAFGGSCVITVFEAGRVTFAKDLIEHSASGREIYAHVGDVLGQVP